MPPPPLLLTLLLLPAVAVVPVGGQGAGSGNYCGASWVDAVSSCLTPCPTGMPTDCAIGETCFADTPVRGGEEGTVYVHQ